MGVVGGGGEAEMATREGRIQPSELRGEKYTVELAKFRGRAQAKHCRLSLPPIQTLRKVGSVKTYRRATPASDVKLGDRSDSPARPPAHPASFGVPTETNKQKQSSASKPQQKDEQSGRFRPTDPSAGFGVHVLAGRRAATIGQCRGGGLSRAGDTMHRMVRQLVGPAPHPPKPLGALGNLAHHR